MSEEIKAFNKLLVNTVEGTIYYMTHWDLPFRPKALRSQVWNLRKKIQTAIKDFSKSQLVQTCAFFFLDGCDKIEEENPDFDHMESDLHVDDFIELLKIWNDSMEVKDTAWDDGEEPMGAGGVQTIKEILAELAEELEQKKAAAQ